MVYKPSFIYIRSIYIEIKISLLYEACTPYKETKPQRAEELLICNTNCSLKILLLICIINIKSPSIHFALT